MARELVNRIQNLRKDADFEVTQRIRVWLGGDTELLATANEYRDLIQSETLCTELNLAENGGESCDLNGHAACLKLQAV